MDDLLSSDEETCMTSYGSIQSNIVYIDDGDAINSSHVLQVDGGKQSPIKSMQVDLVKIKAPCNRKKSINNNSPDRKQLWINEAKAILKLALPVASSYFLDMLPGIVTIALVGRAHDCGESEVDDLESTSKIYIDSTAFAIMLVNFLAVYTGIGLLTAMDTLCSQAYGANESHKIGSYALTATVIMFKTFLLVSFVISHASTILTFLGQPQEIAESAGTFAYYLMLGVPFIYGYEILRKILQAKNDASPLVVSALVNNAVNACVGYYLVNYTEWGWVGAAVAKSIGNIALIPTLLITLTFRGNSKKEKSKAFGGTFNDIWGDSFPWKAFAVESFSNFLGLGIPGMFQLVFEWYAWEAVALLCGLLPKHQAIVGIAANAIILNMTSMTYMLYLGVSVSGSVRLGYALGEGDQHKAEMTSILSLVLSGTISFMNAILLLTLRFRLPLIFTTDVEICDKVSQLLIIGALFQLPDSIYGCVQGLFRGSGRQLLGAKLNFIAYYCIGIPLGYFLGLEHEFGIEGLWIGMTIGLVSVSICGLVFVLKSNWKEFAFNSRTRIEI